MALKLEIFLPGESLAAIDSFQDYIIDVGDLTAKSFGNPLPEGELSLDKLNSFIIIREDELPDTENLGLENSFLVIPIEEEDTNE